MRLPGYSAEAALGSNVTPGARGSGRLRGRPQVVPQQFPPDRERPTIRGCDPESVFEMQCAPCTIRRLPTAGLRWRESVRNCVICYDHNGQAYPRCGPCFERSCSPFLVANRFAIG
jgi:hypothetical protein